MRRRWPNGSAVALAPHIWMGVSVETQRWVERVSILRNTKAAIKFLSCESLLGTLHLDLTGIDWVIVGGESGPGAQPMQETWVLQVRDQCLARGIPILLQAVGAFDAAGGRRGKKAAGRVLSGTGCHRADIMNWLESAESMLQGIVLVGAAAAVLGPIAKWVGHWTRGTVDWKPLVAEILDILLIYGAFLLVLLLMVVMAFPLAQSGWGPGSRWA